MTEHDDMIGEWSLQRCPRCGHRTLVSKDGSEWCGSGECTWMDDENDEALWRELLGPEEAI